MCGIAGILTNPGHHLPLERLARSLQTALQHRGPDDEGVYISSDRLSTLVHTRLSILDLSPSGHQPMSTADGRYWITFNGEIYNFRELRKTLEQDGEQFASQTDTEVIVKLYQRLGKDCLAKLRGMFAFAIWDEHEQTCFIARDPLGIKPLYYWQSGAEFVFASEIKAIVATRLPPLELSAPGLYHYFLSGSAPEPLTLINGINCLPAGHYLEWKPGQNTHPVSYWAIDFNPDPSITPEDAKERVRQALIDSIQHHFVSDVPVGLFLSGGIDSSSLLALARKSQTGTLKTYSIAFEETQWNEGVLAQDIAKLFEADHTEYVVTRDKARDLFPKFLAAIDQPSIDGFNTFCVSKLTHDCGTKVVLSGVGGDELFGGYGSFQKVPQMLRWMQVLATVSPVSRAVGQGIEQFSANARLRRLGALMQVPPSSFAAYRSMRSIFSPYESLKLVQRYLPTVAVHPIQDATVPSFDAMLSERSLTIADTISFLELTQYMRNQLLRDSDVMSMAWGLELRLPMVDRTFLEAIAPIPHNLRLMTGKQLLIQAVPELPDWLVNRPKRGFHFPFQEWVDGTWHESFSNLDTSPEIPLTHWYRKWSLAILQHWLQTLAA
jgi:asparagine synthase (glutamine-hydrolysing)